MARSRARNITEYATVVIAAVVLFLFYRNFFFFYLLTVVALIPLISYIAVKQILPKLEFNVSFRAASIQQGTDVPVAFEITNGSILPLPSALLEFRAENLFYPNEEIQQMDFPLRRGKKTYTWHIQSKYAGRITVKGEKVTVCDYLGLFLFTLDFPCSASVTALPARSEVVMDAVENMFSQGDEQETDNLDYTEDVTQIKDFREYIPGDRMQRVNWKISVKRDELYVKEYELESNRTLSLIAELRKDGEEPGFLDKIVTAFYSAALRLIELEIPFFAVWYDRFTGKLSREFIESNDDLEAALVQMFMMNSYEGFTAYEKYAGAEKGRGDAAIYFTPVSFEHIKEHELIGMYKESVAIICL